MHHGRCLHIRRPEATAPWVIRAGAVRRFAPRLRRPILNSQFSILNSQFSILNSPISNPQFPISNLKSPALRRQRTTSIESILPEFAKSRRFFSGIPRGFVDSWLRGFAASRPRVRLLSTPIDSYRLLSTPIDSFDFLRFNVERGASAGELGENRRSPNRHSRRRCSMFDVRCSMLDVRCSRGHVADAHPDFVVMGHAWFG